MVVVLKGWVKSWVKGWAKDRIQKKLGKSWVKPFSGKFKKRQNEKGTKLKA
ncbi:MAG: hypothetical protein HZB23_13390 [Deltaproteobacteria bacterium]|nr:hypothetical protein [Deltaproteobacteria bacterium]